MRRSQLPPGGGQIVGTIAGDLFSQFGKSGKKKKRRKKRRKKSGLAKALGL